MSNWTMTGMTPCSRSGAWLAGDSARLRISPITALIIGHRLGGWSSLTSTGRPPCVRTMFCAMCASACRLVRWRKAQICNVPKQAHTACNRLWLYVQNDHTHADVCTNCILLTTTSKVKSGLFGNVFQMETNDKSLFKTKANDNTLFHQHSMCCFSSFNWQFYMLSNGNIYHQKQKAAFLAGIMLLVSLAYCDIPVMHAKVP